MINNRRRNSGTNRKFSRLVKESNDILTSRRTRRSSLREGSNVDYPGVTFGKRVVIKKGVEIGNKVLIGKNAFINDGSKVPTGTTIEDHESFN